MLRWYHQAPCRSRRSSLTPPKYRPHSRISLIAAASANGVIGCDGALPWHLPEDLRRFKRLTMGKPIVMGRLTYESIGRPLPGRRNIVLSRNADFTAAGCSVADTVESAIALANDSSEIMVIGGGAVYALFLPLATRIYLTRVHEQIDGDAFFPKLDSRQWDAVKLEESNDQKGGTRVTYRILERRSSLNTRPDTPSLS